MGGASWSSVVRDSKTLEVILDLLKMDTTEAAVIDTMKRRFNAIDESVVRVVDKVLSELQKI